MNLKIKRAIFLLLIIINCIVIFNFSSQDSVKSSKSSDVIVNRVVNTISNVNKKAKKETLRDNVTFVVRKCAHFSIYTLLGVWLMNEANTFNVSKKKKIIICLVFGCLYAISDELHQSFISGRSQEIRDVLIDTSGVLFGCVLVMLVSIVYYRFKSSKGTT